MAGYKYPLGIQSFPEIRNGGYQYIDKTRYIHTILDSGSKYIFLSRPRRFGKSLFISTLESFFSNERQLFKGLAIDTLMPEQWESYPIIHLDFSGENYTSADILLSRLDLYLDRYEKELGLTSKNESPSQRFIKIIWELHKQTGSRVVVLIDEYDNPITSTIDNPELQAQLREILYGFYSCLKLLDEHIKFCMLTGITKYGHLSVFSGLNNLIDISLSDDYAGICGITEDELRTFLPEGVEELAKSEEYSVAKAYDELKDFYDGYHFSRSLVDIYNPFSLLCALFNKHLSDYWFQSGIPTILMKSMRSEAIDFSKLAGSIATESMLNDISAEKTNPIALLYQTGYLTIKRYNRKDRYYILDFPNKEIATGITHLKQAIKIVFCYNI